MRRKTKEAIKGTYAIKKKHHPIFEAETINEYPQTQKLKYPSTLGQNPRNP